MSNVDPIVLCPFNKKHVLTMSRLQIHLIKCSKNYPKHYTCPYSALHRFLSKEDFAQHIIYCPEGTSSMVWKYIQPKNSGRLRETPFFFEEAHALNKEEEDWDAEYEQ